MLINSVNLPVCVRLRTERIHSSKIRYFDLLILIPNVLMFCFLILKCFQKRTKLTFNKPLTLTIYSLIIGITITNIIRCTFVMIYPEQGDHNQELIAKSLWLVCRFMLFWTELNVLLFGLCFGNKKVQAIKIIIFSFVLSSIYIGLQAFFEFRNEDRPVQFQSTNYKLYSSGGMKFLLISSSLFLTMYIINFFVPCLYQRRYEQILPIRHSFFFYCFILTLINLIAIIGTCLNLTNTTIHSLCLLDGTTWILSTCFVPFVYFSFLHRALSSKQLIPQVIYADSVIDDDDDLIDPSTNEKVDGQFDDITASTRIIQENSTMFM